ncbi:hypothetical protein PM082_002222 [Marasmius tenuissimus]|nr:hypothetical protein PM082_002222 [Marasmius tenuissimus]
MSGSKPQNIVQNPPFTIPNLRLDGFRANLPLSSAEIHSTLRSLEPIQAPNESEIAKIQENVAHDLRIYETLIQELRARQATLRWDGAAYLSLRSPIRRMPSEILRLIFAFATEWCTFGVRDKAQNEPNSDRLESAPFRLERVCVRWREIVIGYPKLWSRIAVDLSRMSGIRLRRCIERSQQHPLSLYLIESTGQSDPKTIRLFTEQCGRWQSIRFIGLSEPALQVLSGVSQLPSLEGIVCQESVAEAFHRHLTNATKLKFLTLRVKDFDRLFSNPLPFGDLRHLILENQSADSLTKLVNVLASCGPNLTTLEYAGPADIFSPQL